MQPMCKVLLLVPTVLIAVYAPWWFGVSAVIVWATGSNAWGCIACEFMMIAIAPVAVFGKVMMLCG